MKRKVNFSLKDLVKVIIIYKFFTGSVEMVPVKH